VSRERPHSTGGWNQPHAVGPQAGVGRQQPDQGRDQPARRAQAPVVAGLSRQVAEQMPQPGMGVAHPASLRGVSQQGLHDRQGDQLSIGQLRLQTDLRPPRRQVRVLLQQVISSHIECGREGVYVVRHTMIMDTLVYARSSSLGIGHLVPQQATFARWASVLADWP
jgi:hypothetical protein